MVPANQAPGCEAQGLGGDEAACAMTTPLYCPMLGAQCTKQAQCCTTFGNSLHTQCWNAANQNADAQCMTFLAQYCDNLGAKCAALRATCANLQEPARSSCDINYENARASSSVEADREQACQTAIVPMN
jgi:hypothetical protein